jgi:hypothetical protein
LNIDVRTVIVNHSVECLASNEMTHSAEQQDHARKKGLAFIGALPVRELHGIGLTTADRMKKYDIETGVDQRRNAAFAGTLDDTSTASITA